MFDTNHQPGARPRRHQHETDRGPRAQMWLRDVFDPFRSGRPSVRRGDVRPLILAVLQREPMHGYQVIQELEAQSGGRWRPSAGSVYPTLQQLEDEGLVRSEDVDGRRTYSLTGEGKVAVAAAPPTRSPWGDADARRESIDIRQLALQLVGAVMQVSRAGSPKAKQQARDVLVDARRQMYRLLAEDAGEGDATAPPRAASATDPVDGPDAAPSVGDPA